jgi:hypothetical protein
MCCYPRDTELSLVRRTSRENGGYKYCFASGYFILKSNARLSASRIAVSSGKELGLELGI